MHDDLSTRLDTAASLAEPVRRALLQYVTGAAEPVTRESAAAALGIAPHTAKFHLDRLVADGWLDAGYQRPEGRGGPGAGRPAKVYRRSPLDLDVTVPERRYGLASRLLLAAIGQGEGEVPVRKALRTVARKPGRAAGAHHAGPAVLDALRAHGYDPDEDGDAIVLRNCPFHDLAQQDTELVCGMNVAYLTGLLQGLGATTMQATLDPQPRQCCVRISRRH
jgi:predicted ArsR family transcriptional regulator